MTTMLKAAMAAAALAVPMLAMSAGDASAQNAAACTGRVFVNSIYVSNATFVNGENRFEYSIQVQNQSPVARSVTITFVGFPRDIGVDEPRTRTLTLSSQQQVTVKFGSGTNNNVTLATVGVVQDQAAGRNPYVRLSRCNPV